MGSTVEQDRSHLAEQFEYAGNVADLLTKHVPRAVLDKLAGMKHFLMKKLKSFKSTRNQSELLESENGSS